MTTVSTVAKIQLLWPRYRKLIDATGFEKMISSTPATESRPRLKRDKRYQPCPVEPGDEHVANGIFVFNISRVLAFLDANPTRFAIEFTALATIPDFGGATLDEATVQNADLTQPILFVEISPERYNLLDGRHRVARARRDGVPALPSRKIDCPDHLAHLSTSL